MTARWNADSNNVVVVSVPDEEALAAIATRAVEEGIVRTIVREPDLDNSICAVALQPGVDAQKICASMPLAGGPRVGGIRTLLGERPRVQPHAESNGTSQDSELVPP